MGKTSPPPGFFGRYPRFYSTSVTNSSANRLNQRFRACIGANEEIIRGNRILDLASHDGRWSLAGSIVGARHVVGIEARPHLVAAAVANMRDYGVHEDRFAFMKGDIFSELDHLEAGSIDTVFCFGFFYHTLEHMNLLAKIARLGATHMILDTDVNLRREPIIRLAVEEVEDEADAVAIPGRQTVISGTPSLSALELMLSSMGWRWAYVDWHALGIRCWDKLSDYRDGQGVTLVVTLA